MAGRYTPHRPANTEIKGVWRLQRHSAIHQMRLSADVAGFVGREKDRERRNLLGPPEATHGLALDKSPLHLRDGFAGRLRPFADPAFERRRFDGTGTNRVCPDAASNEVGGDRLGQPDDGGLGCAVGVAIGNAANGLYRG